MKPKIVTAGRTDRRASRTSASRRDQLDFGFLVNAIRQVHEHCLIHAGKAVNITVTLRNWAIGFYIREYEQRGSDRAAYGAGLLEALSERLVRIGVGGVAPRTLRQCRQFYLTYPEIWQSLTAKSSERNSERWVRREQQQRGREASHASAACTKGGWYYSATGRPAIV